MNAAKRINTRKRVKRAAMLGYYNRARIHYSQGSGRWQGINRKQRAGNGQYPTVADCSSFTTWVFWDATRIYGLGDFVNGAGWRAGYTGTQTQHGKRISGRWLLPGDLVFYGGNQSVPGHVAIVVKGGRLNQALVVSHGSEPGPLLVRAAYRPVNQIRRYI